MRRCVRQRTQGRRLFDAEDEVYRLRPAQHLDRQPILVGRRRVDADCCGTGRPASGRPRAGINDGQQGAHLPCPFSQQRRRCGRIGIACTQVEIDFARSGTIMA
jgi:hypothetical protein